MPRAALGEAAGTISKRLGGEIAGGTEERAGGLHRGTAAEQFATILLPNSVAQRGLRWPGLNHGLAKTQTSWAYLI